MKRKEVQDVTTDRFTKMLWCIVAAMLLINLLYAVLDIKPSRVGIARGESDRHQTSSCEARPESDVRQNANPYYRCSRNGNEQQAGNIQVPKKI
jgi:hypothetical protein